MSVLLQVRPRQMHFAVCSVVWALSLFGPQPARANYVAKITQVETAEFPRVRVYVSLLDGRGDPIPDNLPVELELLEGGVSVVQTTLSTGWSVASVLVVDVSGSMRGDKLARAKEAAREYLRLVPQGYDIGLVAFSFIPWVESTPTSDRKVLEDRLSHLTAAGQTALQDAVSEGIDLVRGHAGRRAVLVLTDGIENHSTEYAGPEGFARLLEKAQRERCTISVIGLGKDVNKQYLAGYEVTGGHYLFAPSVDELRAAFATSAKLLARERVIEYTSLAKTPDGMRQRITVKLRVGQESSKTDTTYVRPGVIPHIRGNHLPYFLAILGLLFVPGGFSLGQGVVEVYRFRARHVRFVLPGSPLLAAKDPNVGSHGVLFKVGDCVVICPNRLCGAAHHVRSWRLNRCHCMLEPHGKGRLCYLSHFPAGFRRTLDFWSGHRTSGRGRVWLCRCVGDKEGY